MQDAIIRSLYDDDLSVVQDALSIEGLAAIASPRGLLKAYNDLLVKCTDIIHKGGQCSFVGLLMSLFYYLVQKFVM